METTAIKPPVRKRSPKDTIERIMEAARQQFCKAGLAGARIEEIAREAGVTKQLVYHYYRTKTELYVSVLEDSSSKTIEELLPHEYDHLEPPEALRLFLYRVFDQYVKWPFLASLITDENIHEGVHLSARNKFVSKLPLLLDKFSRIVERGVGAGLFRSDVDPRVLYGDALILITGCFIHRKTVSSFLAVDLNTPQGIAFWREHSIGFVLAALRP
ncbi:MAG: hypothetical protein JWM78_1608 [Verrucomicrobiaceae bacterium]|nr:hypothetical protein [Verrucomicrobiaceae bacterium]